MPCVLIALNKWVDKTIKLAKLSYAVHKAAIQLDAYPDALMRVSEINTQIMGIWDENGSAKDTAEKRFKAFKGYVSPLNKNLHIGGSSVFSFKDVMNMVGMSDKGDDLANSTYASVYRTFGNLTVRKFPEKNIKDFMPFDQFFDSRVLRAAYNRAKSEGYGQTELVAKREYSSEKAGQAIGSASFQITFKVNSAEFDKSALKTLEEIQDNYAASEYPITVIGHTDRTGLDSVNQPLSEERANAVKNFLVNKNAGDFGGNRITTEGKGSQEPPKGVDSGYKGKCDVCRRVEIVIHK